MYQPKLLWPLSGYEFKQKYKGDQLIEAKNSWKDIDVKWFEEGFLQAKILGIIAIQQFQDTRIPPRIELVEQVNIIIEPIQAPMHSPLTEFHELHSCACTWIEIALHWFVSLSSSLPS